MSQDIAIVTGASGGIGQAIALKIHERGGADLRLALHCHKNIDAARALSEKIPGSFMIQADLNQASGRDRLLKETLKHGSPYILVNCAGISKPYELALDISETAFDVIVGANLKTPMFLMKEFGKEMARAGSGVIVNVSSVLARKTLPGSAIYRAAKAAIEEMTKQFAMELGPRGIRVNAVAPGLIDTAMTREIPEAAREKILSQVAVGEMGTPAAVAEAVCQLIENDYINGAVLSVDGGLAL